MRTRNFIICIGVLGMASCSNNITDIGQDLTFNDSYVEVLTQNITETATVKLDSFGTSYDYQQAYYSVTADEIFIGRFDDPVTGVTTTIPYFQMQPKEYNKRIDRNWKLDSLTMDFYFNKKLWGDTMSVQTFYLRQLAVRPTIDQNDPYFYNHDSYPLTDDTLGTFRIVPQASNFQRTYFKLDTAFAKEIFNLYRYANLYNDDWVEFFNYSKGFVITPDESNNTIFSIKANPDSLRFRCHINQSGTVYDTLDIGLSLRSYQFQSCTTIPPADSPLNELDSLQCKMEFKDAGFAVMQGMTGYMIKMNIPYDFSENRGRHVLKAEIELNPKTFQHGDIHLPTTINAYYSEVDNRIRSVITDYSGTAVKGTLYSPTDDTDDDRYRIPITDYYNSIANGLSPNKDENYILLSIPFTEMASSYYRLVVEDMPILRLYYAKYE